jgi:hypothetical protein
MAVDPVRGSPRASALGLRLSPAVEELLARSVSQNPHERPRDAGAFWSALVAAMKTPTSIAPAPFTATVMMPSAPPNDSNDTVAMPVMPVRTVPLPARPPPALAETRFLPITGPPPPQMSSAPPSRPTTTNTILVVALGMAVALIVAASLIGAVWWRYR